MDPAGWVLIVSGPDHRGYDLGSSKLVQFLKLIASLIICQFAGFIGSLFTRPSIQTWYAGLTRPSFAPPDWLFSPVWIGLFGLMAISFFLVWRKGTDSRLVRAALGIFAVQLVLNILWSMLFFGFKSPPAAFIEMVVLWMAIFLTVVTFLRVSVPAGILLIPYLLWVSFAAVLNFSFWRLNL